MLGAVFLREARVAVPPAWGRGDRPGGAGHRESRVDRRGRLGGGQGIDSGGAQNHVAPEAHIGVSHSPGCRPDRLGGVGRPGLARRGAFEEDGREPGSSSQRKAETAVPRPEPNSLDTPGKVTVRGRVLGPDGRPVPGAKLYRTPAIGIRWRPYPSPEYATTGPDGRFQFLADRRAEITLGNEKYRSEQDRRRGRGGKLRGRLGGGSPGRPE